VAHTGAQHLLPQVGTGIDQDICVVVLEQRGGTQPVVARITGSAYLAFASDDGHAL
jgi:hypothetical protein